VSAFIAAYPYHFATACFSAGCLVTGLLCVIGQRWAQADDVIRLRRYVHTVEAKQSWN
jgi:hypothetical protein